MLHYTIILFTHTDVLKDKTLDKYFRKSEALKKLTGQYGCRFHSFGNENRENRDQVTEFLEKMEMENIEKHYTD